MNLFQIVATYTWLFYDDNRYRCKYLFNIHCIVIDVWRNIYCMANYIFLLLQCVIK